MKPNYNSWGATSTNNQKGMQIRKYYVETFSTNHYRGILGSLTANYQ